MPAPRKKQLGKNARPGKARKRPEPVPAHATFVRYDGGSVKMELVFLPADAGRALDQFALARVEDGRKR